MPCQAHINLSALRHNLCQVRALAPHCKIMAMVKGDGYGHGILRVARAMPSVDVFGVARMSEALQLRRAGITQNIILMEGFTTDAELAQIQRHQLQFVIHDKAQLDLLEKTTASGLQAWLKVDTGMHRLGIRPEQLNEIWQWLQGCKKVQLLGVMTHFAQADVLDNDYTRSQIHLFEQLTKTMNCPRSLANSAGIIAWPNAHGDWVRPGIMLYGVSPFPQTTGGDYQLQPVMTLQSELIAVRDVAAGEYVGYGGVWQAKKASRIGVAAIGYADGYPRYAPNGTPVLVNGQMAHLAGRVSMDMLTIELPEECSAQIGDPVILWGRGLPIEKIAEATQTSPYELLCRVTARVEFFT